MVNQKTYKIYNVENYGHINAENRETVAKRYIDIEKACEELNNSKHYHAYIRDDGTEYTLFADIDDYTEGLRDWTKKFYDYLEKNYGIKLTKDKRKYSYTKNTVKDGSYHISFPMFSCNIKNMKILMTGFKKYMQDFKKDKSIDTTVYSNHWYRLPNQCKGDGKLGIHEIMKGDMKDFIGEYINSDQNLDMIIELVSSKKEEKKPEKKVDKIIIEKKRDVDCDEDIDMRIKFINDCLDILPPKYYEEYENWYKIAMILKTQENKYSYEFLNMFREFSKKSEKYSEEDVTKLWNKIDNNKVTINVSSLFYYARESKYEEYKKLRSEYYKNTKIDITEMYLANKIHELSGHLFIYVGENIFCFCEKTNIWTSGDDLLYTYMSTKLYKYMTDLLNDSYYDINFITTEQKKLHSLTQKSTQQRGVALKYKQLFCREDHNIKFDQKPYLFGFKDCVYDIITNELRDYEYDDYMTLHTGYQYQKSNKEDRETVREMIFQIMPDEDKRKLLYQILASSMINKQYQKLFLFNGCGGNGKSFLSKFMKLFLGEYMISIDPIFLTSRPGSTNSSEIFNLNNRRYVVSSEPDANIKLEANIIKRLTGDSTMEARRLYENVKTIDMKCTLILECNKRPFISETSEAIRRRLIDLNFISIFTDKVEEVDEDNNVYLANKNIDQETLNRLKYALFDILRIKARKFIKEEKEIFCVSKHIQDRTDDYISQSNPYDAFLAEKYIYTGLSDDIIKIGDIFEGFKVSTYYLTLKKEEKRNVTKKEIITYFATHPKIKKHYREKYQSGKLCEKLCRRNVLVGYKFISDEEDY